MVFIGKSTRPDPVKETGTVIFAYRTAAENAVIKAEKTADRTIENKCKCHTDKNRAQCRKDLSDRTKKEIGINNSCRKQRNRRNAKSNVLQINIVQKTAPEYNYARKTAA